jgi:hypothetical protein
MFFTIITGGNSSMTTATKALLQTFKVALMKESFFDAHMSGLKTTSIKGLTTLVACALDTMRQEKLLLVDDVEALITASLQSFYLKVGAHRQIEEIFIPLFNASVNPQRREEAYRVLQMVLELHWDYGLHILRFSNLQNAFRPSTVVAKIRASGESTILAEVFWSWLTAARSRWSNLSLVDQLVKVNERLAEMETELKQLEVLSRSTKQGPSSLSRRVTRR